MSLVEPYAYETELKRVVRQLGLPLVGNLEEAIIRHCQDRVAAWIAVHERPNTLTELLDLFTASLNMEVAEVHDAADLEALLQRIPPRREPAMAQLQREFGDGTDAITMQRTHPQPWEPPFLAVINCQGWHLLRRYFSKWHEVVHRLLDGEQLRFAFRHTPVDRPEPEEVLVDRVAAVLAFYPAIFEPAFREELEREGRLTFEVADRIRQKVVPDASRQATLRACLRHCSSPVWFLRCAMGLKRAEEQRLNSPQLSLLSEALPKPEPKLRVRDAAYSFAAGNLAVRFHQNMQVPEASAVAQAFRDPWAWPQVSREPLAAWETSTGGPIGRGDLVVEAVRMDQEVWALVHISPRQRRQEAGG